MPVIHFSFEAESVKLSSGPKFAMIAMDHFKTMLCFEVSGNGIMT